MPSSQLKKKLAQAYATPIIIKLLYIYTQAHVNGKVVAPIRFLDVFFGLDF
jgi:hypothetical protein